MNKPDNVLRIAILDFIRNNPDCTSHDISEALDKPVKIIQATMGHMNRDSEIEMSNFIKQNVTLKWRVKE